jgi:hypothetical protein
MQLSQWSQLLAFNMIRVFETLPVGTVNVLKLYSLAYISLFHSFTMLITADNVTDPIILLSTRE